MILLFRALFLLVIYDILRVSSRFKTVHSIVKSWRVSARLADSHTVDGICTAVNYACVWYPKQVLCLQRSFVTTYLLRKQGVSANMVLGAQKLPFKAHAWVEINGETVNERSNVQAIYAIWDRC